MPLFALWRKLSDRVRGRNATASPEAQAKNLIDAIDAGGIPLNPARINEIARRMGLEVSTKAPVEQTIARIRSCINR
jgi:hypothetical protein